MVQTRVRIVGVYFKGELTALAGRLDVEFDKKESGFWPEQMEG